MKGMTVLVSLLILAAAVSLFSTKPSKYGDLPSQVGETGHEDEYFPLDQAYNLLELTEYGPHTGKYFKRRGGFHFDVTAGPVKPGSAVGAKLKVHSAEKTIRYQLTERDRKFKRIKLISEKTGRLASFSTELPKKENTLYVLSIEILDDKGRTEDSSAELIFAQTPSVNAKMSLKGNESIKGNDILKLNLENFGPQQLSTGVSYRFEKHEYGKWREIITNSAFISIGIGIKPGEEKEFNILFDAYNGPGRYRVIKDVSPEYSNKQTVLAKEFDAK